jgi:hypothetical protein
MDKIQIKTSDLIKYYNDGLSVNSVKKKYEEQGINISVIQIRKFYEKMELDLRRKPRSNKFELLDDNTVDAREEELSEEKMEF